MHPAQLPAGVATANGELLADDFSTQVHFHPCAYGIPISAGLLQAQLQPVTYRLGFGCSAGTNSAPRYIIEDLGPDPSGSLVVGQGVSYQIYYFQITARGFGAQSNAQTLVQSVYAKGY